MAEILFSSSLESSTMDANKTFKLSDWLDKGKEWASALPMLRKIAAVVFAMPQRSGIAEASDAEDDESGSAVNSEPAALGRGQRKKIAARRYQGPAWEEH